MTVTSLVVLFLASSAITVGVLAVATSPSPPFSHALRWISLFLGAGLLGAWYGARRRPASALKGGRGLAVGSASILLVDEDRICVLPAESLQVDEDRVSIAGRAIASGELSDDWREFASVAVERARSDEGGRDSDPWRQLAIACGQSRWRSRSRDAIGRWAVLFALAGLLFELVSTPWRGPASRWGDVQDQFRETTAALQHQYKQRNATARAEALAHYASSNDPQELGELLLNARGVWVDPELAKVAQERYRKLVRSAAGRADLKTVSSFLEQGIALELDDSHLGDLRRRYVSLAERKLSRISNVKRFDIELFSAIDKFGLSQAFRRDAARKFNRLVLSHLATVKTFRQFDTRLLDSTIDAVLNSWLVNRVRDTYTQLVRDSAQEARSSREIVRVLKTATLGDDLRGEVRSLLAKSVRSELSLARSTWKLEQLQAIAKEYELGKVVEDEIDEEFLVQARRKLAGVRSGVGLAKIAQAWVAKAPDGLAKELEGDIARTYSRVMRNAVREVDLRALLSLGEVGEAREREEVRARLWALCQVRYSPGPGTDNDFVFLSKLLSALCFDGDPTLRYTLSTEVEGVGAVMPDTADALSLMARLSGAPMKVTPLQAPSHTHVSLSVEQLAAHGGPQYPCAVTLTHTPPRGGDAVSMRLRATCVAKRQRHN